ncbi:hypothetical protein OAE13_03580 [Flavobacteriaceae bacterium]|nr:hypothetical protein [Flavobacteriaceae bacterium]
MSASKPYKLSIKAYEEDLALVKELRILIESKYPEIFHCIVVHGSVATNEIIPYSDFDGLLIVKDRYVNSKQLKTFKKESMKLILKFDPLQHHGWFQIKESDLLNYPENYLPLTTLEHSKLIYPQVSELELSLEVNKEVDYKTTLESMLNQFEKREIENWRPANIYQLKSVLSQVMLIPCLYFSAIHNDGIFKRESFKVVKSNFNENEWMPIKTATVIRNNWNYKSNAFQKLMLSSSNKIIRKIAVRYFAPKIPINIRQEFDNIFYDNLMLLVKKIKKDIK